jgi:hypothetical protein
LLQAGGQACQIHNVAVVEHKEAIGSTPTAVPIGFCHVTSADIDDGDAATSPHHMEPLRGE